MDIVEKSAEYVKQLFSKMLPENRCFHCLSHTKTVVKASEIIGTESGLDQKSMSILLTAAWFHDTGHTRCYNNHEKESENIATEALANWGISQADIKKVVNCIEATRLPQNPRNIMEKVLCDADMYHLSQDYYWENNSLLKQELSKQLKKEIPDSDWYRENLKFLKRHKYFTDHGNHKLEPKKQSHIAENQAKLKELTSYL